VAIETVLKESLDQVEAANDCLRQEVSDQNLRLILSHYCSRILLRRLVHFVEQRAEDGLLSKEEASAYFRDMDSSIREVMKCCGHMISQDQSKALDDEEGLCCQCSKFCIRDVNAEASENKGS
jgi:polyhydroxyalkanoate synthesis regulator phasin